MAAATSQFRIVEELSQRDGDMCTVVITGGTMDQLINNSAPGDMALAFARRQGFRRPGINAGPLPCPMDSGNPGKPRIPGVRYRVMDGEPG